MKNVAQLINQAGRALKSNSPVILAGLGISGVVTTAYLAARAGHAHARRMSEEAPYLSIKEEAAIVWPLYIPAGVSGAVTVGCVVAACRVGSRRAAALTAAYSISEKAFAEYKDKVIEKYGEKKEEQIRDEIAQDRINKNPPEGVVVVGSGSVLCCELYTGRYFMSDMESLRKAQNDINAKIMRDLYVTLSEFYYNVGLPDTSYSSNMGWDSDVLMELQFSTVMSEDNRPCIAFEYNYVKPLT
jgi:hypothetical protein